MTHSPPARKVTHGTTAALCAVFAVVLALGQVVSARHRAGGAADL
ncbi:pilus assembly protein TadG-related protein, partial [Streptomyces sp. NPDC048301]